MRTSPSPDALRAHSPCRRTATSAQEDASDQERFSATTRLGFDSGNPRLPLIVIELDLGHSIVTLSDEDAELLRDLAAAQAGRSAAARDLSLLLNQALSGRRRIALQRAEANTLRHITTADRRLTHLVTTFDQPASDPKRRDHAAPPDAVALTRSRRSNSDLRIGRAGSASRQSSLAAVFTYRFSGIFPIVADHEAQFSKLWGKNQ